MKHHIQLVLLLQTYQNQHHVRGGGPATRETDLLNPINMVQQIHAVMLSGGSAFGLDAASGAMQYLEEQHEFVAPY